MYKQHPLATSPQNNNERKDNCFKLFLCDLYRNKKRNNETCLLLFQNTILGSVEGKTVQMSFISSNKQKNTLACKLRGVA